MLLHEDVGAGQRGRRPQAPLPAEYDVTNDKVASEGEQGERHEEQGDRFRVCFCFLPFFTLKMSCKVFFLLSRCK